MAVRLEIQFDDADSFAREFEKNISKGGAFIASSEEPALRDMIEVALDLSFCGEHRVLEAEVVHVQPGVGIAVQFSSDVVALRDELEAFAATSASSTPLPTPEVETTAASRVDAPQTEPLVDAAGEAAPFSDVTFDAADDELEVSDEDLDAELEIDGSGLGVLDAPGPSEDDPLVDVDDRRRSPRSTARVPARLDATNLSLDGRTRDISDTGVLVSADASELPIGKTVQLQLQNPETGEQFSVAGKVSRHIEGEGTVAAVGVDFEPADGQRTQLQGFVDDAKRIEAERTEGGISGRIEELGMANLLQMLCNSSQLGTLTARVGAEEGVFAFEDGVVRYVRLGSLRGIKALSRMFTWEAGRFQFHSHVDDLDEEDDSIPLTNALLEAARQLDEAVRPGLRQFDPRTTFSVDLSAIPSTELTQVENAVLELAMPGLTLRRILDVIPETDATVLEAIAAMAERGVMTPQDPE